MTAKHYRVTRVASIVSAMKRLGAVAAVLLGALAIVAPATAAGTPGVVSPREFAHVYQWDEKGHVDLVFDRSGHRKLTWTDPDGHRLRLKVYPTTVEGGYALVVFLNRFPNSNAWAVWSMRWCQADESCTVTVAPPPEPAP